MLQERDKNQLDYKLCSVSIIMHTFFSILENFWLVWVPLLKILCVHIGTRLYRQGMLYCFYCHGPMKSYLVWLCTTRGRIMSDRLIVNALYGQVCNFCVLIYGIEISDQFTFFGFFILFIESLISKILVIWLPNWRSFIFKEIVFYILQYEI